MNKAGTRMQGIVAAPRRIAWYDHSLLPAAVALLPLIVLLVFISAFTVDIPFWDQWQFVPLIEKSYQGNLSIYDLWSQHNEHRLLFPRLIMLVLAHWSSWEVRYEMFLNIGLGILTCGVLVYLVKGTLTELGISKLGWLLPLVSFMVFSLVHWDNWSWGWQIQIFLNVCAAVACVVLLSGANAELKWPRLIGAMICAVIASYSFANGLLLWPIGLVLIYARQSSQGGHGSTASRTRALFLLAWVVAGLLTIGSYVYDYSSPRYNFSALGYLVYVLTYLGTPMVNFSAEGAAIAGLCGILGQGYLLVTLLRRYAIPVRALLPYMALSAFALCTALGTGVGRSDLGSGQAASPRYVTIAYLFWLVTLFLLYLLWARTPSKERLFRLWPRVRQYAGLCIGAIVCLTLLSSVRGGWGIVHKYSDLERVRAALVAGNPSNVPSNILEIVYSDPAVVRAGIGTLMKRHLSLYDSHNR